MMFAAAGHGHDAKDTLDGLARRQLPPNDAGLPRHAAVRRQRQQSYPLVRGGFLHLSPSACSAGGQSQDLSVIRRPADDDQPASRALQPARRAFGENVGYL